MDPSAAQRRRYLNTVAFPLMRCSGLLILGLLATLHNAVLPPANSLAATTLWSGLALYGLAAWAILRLGFSESGPGNSLPFLLFALDVPVFCWVIYLTGGPSSWLFAILLVRVTDQAHFSLKRALLFVHGVSAAYLALMVYCQATGMALNWPLEGFKALMLYLCGIYISQTATTNQRMRRDLVRAIRSSQESVDALHQSNKRLLETKQHLERATMVRDMFLRAASHELRTPLNGILGFCDLLRLDLHPEKKHRYIKNIKVSGTRLLETVERILCLSESRTRSDVVNEEIDLREFLEDMAREARFSCPEEGPEIALKGPLKVRVRGDREGIEMLTRQLFHDARESSGPDGKVEIVLEPQDDDSVRLSLQASSPAGFTSTRGAEDDFHAILASALAKIRVKMSAHPGTPSQNPSPTRLPIPLGLGFPRAQPSLALCRRAGCIHSACPRA